MQLGLSFKLSFRGSAFCLFALTAFLCRAGVAPQVPAESQPGSFVVAYGGESYLFNYEAGIVKASFLHNVYKPFGFSQDSRYFLYLKSNGVFPTFSLYSYDLVSGADTKLSADSVHHAAWSPAGPEVAAVSLDASNQFHVAIYNSVSGSRTEVASGMIQPEFLEWSPNGNELLYVKAIPLTPTYISDQQFRYELHRYSVNARKDVGVPDAMWARFDGSRLILLSKKTLPGADQLPNTGGEDIRDFDVSAGDLYATVIEAGQPVVKRLDPRTGSYSRVAKGQLYTATSTGVVARDFEPGGVTYTFVSNSSSQPAAARLQSTQPRPLATARSRDREEAEFTTQLAASQTAQTTTFSSSWEMPYGGTAFLVQGGTGFSPGVCDGGVCIITSHTQALAYALDWQQVGEQGQGNYHILAIESGTVAATQNSVTCNSNGNNTNTCPDYSKTCNDPSGGLGNYVAIAHPDGSYSFYGHMKFGSVQVAANQAVSQGTYIGIQGHTGVAGTYNNYHGCGDHLHFQRQTSAAPWAQSIATPFTELPCAMTCTTSYLSANIENAVAPVSSLSVALVPSTVIGSATTTANRVVLPSPAPSGGALVSLSSSNPSIVTVPSSISVPAGATSATFNLTASPVSAQVSVTISASYGGINAPATLTVTPVSLSRMNLFQFSITGGNTINGNELDITAAAPNDFPIALSSSAPAIASGPSSVIVPAGATSANFSISTAPVSSGTGVTISATDGASTKSATLQVNAGGTVGSPTLTSVSPAGGLAGSAVPVTLTGTNFVPGAAVNVSGTGITVSGVSVSSTTQITATFTIASGASVGNYSVTVTTPAGTSAAATFSVNPASGPAIFSVSPGGGIVGTTLPVTITGANFLAGSTVSVSSSDITVTNVTVVNATQITATFAIASSASLASYNVAVITSAGASNLVPFTVSTFAPIRVDAGGPAYTDALGQTWSADNGFTNSGGTYTFPGTVYGTSVPAIYSSARWGSSTSAPMTYTARVPNANYTVNLKFADGVVTGPGQRLFNVILNGRTVLSNFDIVAQSGGQYQAIDKAFPVNVTNGQITIQFVPVLSTAKVNAIEILPGTVALPVITSVNPATVAPGATVPVTITGANLISGVVLNAGPGTSFTNVTMQSASQITASLAVAANAAAGTNNLTVTTPGGTSAPIPLTIGTSTPPAPTLTSIAPSSGTAGTSVPLTLTGTNFVSGATVSVSNPGISVSGITVAGSTQITATFAIVSNAATGPANVRVTTEGGTSGAVTFSVNPAPPTLTAVSPNAATVGTSVPVALTGTNFAAGATVNVSSPDITVSNTSVVSATQLTATFTVSGTAATGTFSVTVTTAGGTSGAVPFSITAVSPPPPTLASISPNAGTAGTSVPVTLTGTNFSSGAVVSVSNPGIAVSSVAVTSVTQITAMFAISSAAATGAANVTVTTGGGTSAAVQFTVNPPAATSVRVNAGGPQYTDPLGQVWSADSGFTVSGGTTTITGTVLGTSAPALYPTARWGNPPGSAAMTYTTAAPNGSYIVNLKFVDGWKTAPGQRLFNIVINGQTVASNFDIVGRSGGQMQALDFAVPVSVTGGQITVQFVPVVSNPKVCAIEIIPGGVAAPIATGISPQAAAAGAGTAVTISGSGFTDDVVVNAGPNIQVTNVVVASPTQITATFIVASGTAPGNANITVTTPGGTTAPLTFATQ